MPGKRSRAVVNLDDSDDSSEFSPTPSFRRRSKVIISGSAKKKPAPKKKSPAVYTLSSSSDDKDSDDDFQIDGDSDDDLHVTSPPSSTLRKSAKTVATTSAKKTTPGSRKKAAISSQNTTSILDDDSSISVLGGEPRASKPKSSQTPLSGKKTTPSKSSTPTSKPEMPDSYDILVPSVGTNASGECTLLVQINPQDAAVLDFHGASGAIGRFEADETAVTLDLKGCQYRGHILPGPTVMVATSAKLGASELKVEAITDEFVQLVKGDDLMAKLDAVMVRGEMDAGFRYEETNVNRSAAASSSEPNTEQESSRVQKLTKGTPGKRKASATKKGKSSNKNK